MDPDILQHRKSGVAICEGLAAKIINFMDLGIIIYYSYISLIIKFYSAVLGPLEPSALGQTLTHEHVMIDASKYITPPEYGSCDTKELDFDLCHLGKIRHFP